MACTQLLAPCSLVTKLLAPCSLVLPALWALYVDLIQACVRGERVLMGEKLRYLGMEVALDFSLTYLNDVSFVSSNMVSFSTTTTESPLHSVALYSALLLWELCLDLSHLGGASNALPDSSQ